MPAQDAPDHDARSGWLRRLPFLVVVAIAILGAVFFRDQLSFETLAQRREELLAFRDAHYLQAVGLFILTYIAIVALCLPGGTVATLTGGFLFGLFPGVFFNVASAATGAVLIFLVARSSFGDRLVPPGDRRRRASVPADRGDPARTNGRCCSSCAWCRWCRSCWRTSFPAFTGIEPVIAMRSPPSSASSPAVWSSPRSASGLGEVFERGETPDLGIIFSPPVLLPAPGPCGTVGPADGAEGLPERASDMARIDTDICVIGAGSGGLSVAAGAVQMGARVVLIEAGEMGGDCLNAGCVPSKALIAAAKAAEAQRRGFRGVAAVEPTVDFGAVKDHVAAVIAQIAPVDSQERFEGLGCTVIRAFARFTGPREVEAGGQTIRARRFVIATGSRPFVPPIQGVDTVPYLTNETIFALRERPEHLVVIGGGPIGVELAQAHRRLGCEVTVVEGARVLGREDPELAAYVIGALQAEGIRLIEGQPVVRLAGSAGAVEVTLGDGTQVKGSHLLMAVGRKVALEGMNLEAAGIAHTPKGVTVDARLRSTQPAGLCGGRRGGGPAVHPCRGLARGHRDPPGDVRPARQGRPPRHSRAPPIPTLNWPRSA